MNGRPDSASFGSRIHGDGAPASEDDAPEKIGEVCATRIRPATEADVEGLARSHMDTWRVHYRGILPDPYLDALSNAKRASSWRIILHERQATVLVVEDEEAIVGHVSFGPERTGSFPAYPGEVYSLYLLPDRHGRGVGGALWRAARTGLESSGRSPVMVWTLARNPTRSFYEHMGGVLIGQRGITVGGRDLVEVAYGYPESCVFG